MPRVSAARAVQAGSVPPADTKLPKIDIVGLTPSQRIFSIATCLDPLSLSISSGDEYFLFMNLRAEHKWASYDMTPPKWVEAATIYNTELEKHNRSLGHFRWTSRKTPCALLNKLSEVEALILRRLASGDYKCTFAVGLSDRISDASLQQRSPARRTSGRSIAMLSPCSKAEVATSRRYTHHSVSDGSEQ